VNVIMKKTAIIPLILGLGIGLFAVKLAVDTIRKAQAASSSARVIQVVQAAQDIDAQSEITPEMVKLIETSDTSLAPQHERMEKLDDVVGRVTAKSIPANVPVLASMLAPKGTPAGLQGRIRPGYRAVSIRIDEASAVAYQIKAGDWVDVIVVMDIESGLRGKKETIAKVILEHVEVAAIGHDSNVPAGSGPNKVKPAKSATLLVEEAQAPKLHLAATRGKLTLAMRGENDMPTAGVPIEVTSFDEVVIGLRPPVVTPGTEGKPPFWMEMAKGLFGAGQDDPDEPKKTAKKVQPVAQSLDPMLQPTTVIVFRSNSGRSGGREIERVTFAGANSSTVLEMRGGAPTPASNSMLGGPGSSASSSSRSSGESDE
jgi:pilus assembly protein CpaB